MDQNQEGTESISSWTGIETFTFPPDIIERMHVIYIRACTLTLAMARHTNLLVLLRNKAAIAMET